MNSFQVIIKNMTHSIDFLVKELDKTKINDDDFFGNDLIFLNKF